MAERKAWVMHLPTGVVGRAEKYYDADKHLFFPDDSPAALDKPVLRLHQGHALLAVDENFLELSTAEVSFYVHALAMQEEAVLEMAKLGGNSQIEPGKGLMLVRSVLSAQLSVLNVAARAQ